MTVATVSNGGLNDCRIDLPDIIVTSDRSGQSLQPWSPHWSYTYRVRVSARDAGDHMTTGYGSAHDYEHGDDTGSEDMAWMVLRDLLDAYSDPDEFWTNATTPDTSYERARIVLEIIDYAAKIGPMLEPYSDEINERNQ